MNVKIKRIFTSIASWTWTYEKYILEFIEEKKFPLFIMIITLFGLLIRIPGLDFISVDAEWCLLPWFDEIREAGGMQALEAQVGNYNILYQFVIACMTYLPFEPLCMYKGLSIIFDFILAGAVGVTVYKILDKSKYMFAFAYAIVLFLPTDIINSSVWAQCDSIYTSMLILTLYCLYYKKYKASFIFYGMAMAFKLQAVFLLPFLFLFYFIEKEFSVFTFLISFITFYLTCIPGFLYGRSILDPVKIYFSQADTTTKMSYNFPSFWIMAGEKYGVFRSIAILTTIVVLGMCMLRLIQKKPDFKSAECFFGIAAWVVWSCILFLPAMHDRYGYFLDILLVILAFIDRKYILFACTAIISSCIIYGPFLFDKEINMMAVAVFYFIVYLAYTYVLNGQEKFINEDSGL